MAHSESDPQSGSWDDPVHLDVLGVEEANRFGPAARERAEPEAVQYGLHRTLSPADPASISSGNEVTVTVHLPEVWESGLPTIRERREAAHAAPTTAAPAMMNEGEAEVRRERLGGVATGLRATGRYFGFSAREDNSSDSGGAATSEMLDVATLGEMVQKLVAMTVNFKNSGKTVTSAYLAATLAELTRKGTVVLDASPSGVAAERFGITPGGTLKMPELAHLIADNETQAKAAFARLLAQNPNPSVDQMREISHEAQLSLASLRDRLPNGSHGVQVVGADRSGQELNGTQMAQVVKLVDELVPFTVIDTGSKWDSVMDAALQASGVLLLPVNPSVKDSLYLLGDSMEALRAHGHGGLVDRGIVVISNLRRGTPPQEYYDLSYFKGVGPILEQGDAQGALLGVPHDKHIAFDGKVNLNELNRRTREAFRTVARTVLTQQLRLQQALD